MVKRAAVRHVGNRPGERKRRPRPVLDAPGNRRGDDRPRLRARTTGRPNDVVSPRQYMPRPEVATKGSDHHDRLARSPDTGCSGAAKKRCKQRAGQDSSRMPRASRLPFSASERGRFTTELWGCCRIETSARVLLPDVDETHRGPDQSKSAISWWHSRCQAARHRKSPRAGARAYDYALRSSLNFEWAVA